MCNGVVQGDLLHPSQHQCIALQVPLCMHSRGLHGIRHPWQKPDAACAPGAPSEKTWSVVQILTDARTCKEFLCNTYVADGDWKFKGEWLAEARTYQNQHWANFLHFSWNAPAAVLQTLEANSLFQGPQIVRHPCTKDPKGYPNLENYPLYCKALFKYQGFQALNNTSWNPYPAR